MINYIFQSKCYLKYSFPSANTNTPQYDPITEIGLTFSGPVLCCIDWLTYNTRNNNNTLSVKLLSLMFVLLYCRGLSKASMF